METTGLASIVTAIETGLTDFAAVIPELAVAAIGVGVILFAARKGWRFVKSMV